MKPYTQSFEDLMLFFNFCFVMLDKAFYPAATLLIAQRYAKSIAGK